MIFFVWMALGLIVGFVASKIFSKSGEVAFHDILLGIIGAVDGGYLFQTSGVGSSIYSILVAVVGAVVVSFVYHTLVRRRV